MRILGTQLTNASSVTFNSIPATFEVVSPSFIKARVPADASSGGIEVTTPSGIFTGNVPFQVIR
ncbi:MAG: hypothetical protein H0X25_14625 [Acidobacteriales bacterium]|nr:hypothetical protein [Terriglobales bacterium]